MDERVSRAIASIKVAEKMAPAGSHEQVELVKAALYQAWPTIEAYFSQKAGDSEARVAPAPGRLFV